MKEITINCAKVASMAEIHDLLSRELNFPGWYGRNLDALHDMLTGICEETHITFLHFPALPFPPPDCSGYYGTARTKTKIWKFPW